MSGCREGKIEQLRVLAGHPLLVPAALDAVRLWLYEPTRLNGNPVEVLAPIEVHFRLYELKRSLAVAARFRVLSHDR